jgi:hypothetical protein|tara:strand:+ start:114 stop:236 length:123 start_codon:yes stop_codon:yes gene_type:complete
MKAMNVNATFYVEIDESANGATTFDIKVPGENRVTFVEAR